MISKNHDDRGDSRQNFLFCILFIVGFVIACTIIFAPLHEEGHVNAARIDGQKGIITGWNTCQVTENSPHVMISGFLSEFFFFLCLFILFFAISNPYKGGIHKYYAHLGFPWGYCNGIFIYAFFSTDFAASPMYAWAWVLFTLPILILGWILLILCRLKSR